MVALAACSPLEACWPSLFHGNYFTLFGGRCSPHSSVGVMSPTRCSTTCRRLNRCWDSSQRNGAGRGNSEGGVERFGSHFT